MECVITLLELLFVWLLTFIMGTFFTKSLLPSDIEKEFGTYIAPTIGYLVFCLIAFTLSSTFKLSAVTACWITFPLLFVAGCLTQLRSAWRLSLFKLNQQLKHCVLLVLPMALVILLPLFYLGANTYLGSVNPDYFAGVIDNYYLMHGNSVIDFQSAKDSYSPINYMAGSISPSARFGAGIFAILVQLLLHISTRTSLTLIISFFLLNLPLVVYVFSSIILGFTRKQATLAGWLIGISAPVSMSYLYFYLGQNSGLPALPLVMITAYLMLVRPGIRTLILCVIVSDALFINYFAMLPYALAPAGVLGLYFLVSGRFSIKQAAGLVAGFLALFILLHLGNIHSVIDSMRAWGQVIGQTLQGQFFLDFLTELVLPMILGVACYPTYNSWLNIPFESTTAIYVVLALAVTVLLFWIGSIINWIRNTKELERKIFILSALVIYLAVWWMYTFLQQYAYAVFKMTSWLQFIIVPFMAYGLYQLHARLKKINWRGDFSSTLSMTVIYGIGICYVATNFISNVQYIYYGFGHDTKSGYIVNNFEMSGNKDYFELPKAITQYVKPNESISLLFTDSIQNYWVSYYLHDFRQSIPFHEIMPGDDENLPDIETDTVMDYYGNIRKVNNPFANGYKDNYFLVWNKEHANRDITTDNFTAEPLWQNHTFRLFDARQINDILTTAKGFYRLEYIKPNDRYWTPSIVRWSAHGGEFYLLQVKNPGRPYRLVFDVIVGYEFLSNSRTLELWLNGKKFQTITVTNTARVISDAFYPDKGINKIVVFIKENNDPMKRRVALWNNNIPADYRRLNAAFANVRILSPSTPAIGNMVPLNKPIMFLQLFNFASQFNGLGVDGWMGDVASVSFIIPANAKKIEIKGFVPGIFSFPYQIFTNVNGVAINKLITTPGNFTLDLPILHAPREITIVLKMPQNKALTAAEEVNIRHKVIKQSLRIDSISFS